MFSHYRWVLYSFCCEPGDGFLFASYSQSSTDNRPYLICISLILAGAIGNIIDSIFYGVIFSQSTLSEVATFVPIGHGYTDWLYGKVVDKFYFPLFEFNWPGWMPFIGGDNFIFFSPIINFADAAISCGVIILLLFYKKYSSDSIHMIKNDLKSKLAS